MDYKKPTMVSKISSKSYEYSPQESGDNSDNKNPDQWEDRMSKCRERNREHAKKTRLRKKMGLDGMKGRLLELQTEVNFLVDRVSFQIFEYIVLSNLLSCQHVSHFKILKLHLNYILMICRRYSFNSKSKKQTRQTFCFIWEAPTAVTSCVLTKT